MMKPETTAEYWKRAAASARMHAEMDAVGGDPGRLERDPRKLRAKLEAQYGPAPRRAPAAPRRAPATATAVVRNTARAARRVTMAGLTFTLDAGRTVVGTPRLTRQRGRDTIVVQTRDASGKLWTQHELTAEEKHAVYATNRLQERRSGYEHRG